jgi:hypothetical protein
MEVKLVKRDDHYGLYNEDGHKIAATLDGCNSKLSKQNCDEIFGVVDLEDLAIQSDFKNGSVDGISFKLGFNKAMELNKDKVFTLEDVRKAFNKGYLMKFNPSDEYTETLTGLVQSLQQPTEIEVEIVTTTRMENGKSGIDTPTIKPKLDSEGCLILKKI